MSSIGPIKRGEYLEVRSWAQDQAKQEKKIYVILKCEDKDEENNFYACPFDIVEKYDLKESVQIIRADGIVIDIKEKKEKD